MAKTEKSHQARWFVYAGSERIPHTSRMRGQWGYDVECSCGWKTRTGGAVRSYVQTELDIHRLSERDDSGS
jgi:hypothetical protein